MVTMKEPRWYQVKEVARIAGISVRTLHHYDEIGLLVPKVRTAAGYRLYGDDDLLRLQQIFIGREFGLALEEIRRSLDDPDFDHRQALQAQRERLRKRAQQIDAAIRAVDAALAILATEKGADIMDIKQIFEGFDSSKYAQEVRERWGDTDAHKESTNRASRYSAEDWSKIKSDQAAIYGEAATAMNAGKKPTDREVMDIADRHRLLIDRWFYPCSIAMHSRLANLFESDGRFAENINRHGEGLAVFLTAAIRANVDRYGG